MIFYVTNHFKIYHIAYAFDFNIQSCLAKIGSYTKCLSQNFPLGKSMRIGGGWRWHTFYILCASTIQPAYSETLRQLHSLVK